MEKKLLSKTFVKSDEYIFDCTLNTLIFQYHYSTFKFKVTLWRQETTFWCLLQCNAATSEYRNKDSIFVISFNCICMNQSCLTVCTSARKFDHSKKSFIMNWWYWRGQSQLPNLDDLWFDEDDAYKDLVPKLLSKNPSGHQPSERPKTGSCNPTLHYGAKI